MSRTKQNQPHLCVSCRQLASHEAAHFPYSFSRSGLFLCTCVLITGPGVSSQQPLLLEGSGPL